MSLRGRTFGSYDLLVFGIALLGLLDVTHLALQQQRGFEEGCFGEPSFGAAVPAPLGAHRGVPARLVLASSAPRADCGSVLQSEAGTFLGLSNIGWGFLFYGALAVVSLLRGTNEWRRELLGMLREVLVVVGFGYTIFLVYVQLFVLEQICTLCMISAGLVTILFALTAWALWTEEAGEEDAGSDPTGAFGGADPLGWYLAGAAVWVILAIADVVVFGGGFGTVLP